MAHTNCSDYSILHPNEYFLGIKINRSTRLFWAIQFTREHRNTINNELSHIIIIHDTLIIIPWRSAFVCECLIEKRHVISWNLTFIWHINIWLDDLCVSWIIKCSEWKMEMLMIYVISAKQLQCYWHSLFRGKNIQTCRINTFVTLVH